MATPDPRATAQPPTDLKQLKKVVTTQMNKAEVETLFTSIENNTNVVINAPADWADLKNRLIQTGAAVGITIENPA